MDDPLVGGLVDKMEEAGLRSFGPKANAAIIEGSKAFSKQLMKKYSIPTAKYEIFTEEQAALDYLETQPMPIVIKCDGLALGKGVIIAQNLDEAKQAVKDMMEDQKFGSAGSTIVIEECMTGPELTVLAFSDGNTCVPMVSSRDHKRAYDHDEGLNTGGMGAVTPGADMTDELKARIQNEIITPTVEALKKEGRPFKGVIYFGLMLTPEGPKVVEYNARFGDPEAQAVLPLLENSLLDIVDACIDGTLDKVDFKWKNKCSCVVVMASGGYPQSYAKGYEITGIDTCGKLVFQAGTALKDGKLVTPKSGTILPSITRRSLCYVAKEYLGMEVEEREVFKEELKDFAECGLCGTAAVISPVGELFDNGETMIINNNEIWIINIAMNRNWFITYTIVCCNWGTHSFRTILRKALNVFACVKCGIC